MQRHIARLRKIIAGLHPAVVAVLIGCAYFAVQYAFIGQYGVTWDEPLHRNWGKIFGLFFRTGDRSIFSYLAGNGIYYGPLYPFANFELSAFFVRAYWLPLAQANHVLNLFTASAAVGCLFVLASAVGGRRVGFFSSAALIFFPSFLAHSHYNTTDIPLMTAILVTATFFTVGLLRDRRWMIVLSAGLFGMSVAIKVSALIMAPVFLLTYALWVFDRSRTSQVSWRTCRIEFLTIVLAIIACGLGLYLAWPTAWGDIGIISRSVRMFLGSDFWSGRVLFFGKEYAAIDLPWFYTAFEYLAALPVLSIVAFCIGGIVVVRSLKHTHRRVSLLFLALWVLFPLFLSMKPGLVRYDGMRQFFFCLPAIAVLCGLGFDAALEFVTRKFSAHLWVPYGALLIILFLLLREVFLIHPFEGSYRNELVRFIFPRDLDHQFQIEYWGPTYKQGMDWLTENAEPNPVICVPVAGILLNWYPGRPDFDFDCSKRTNYVMFFTRYTETGNFSSLPMEPVYVISRYDSALLKIYKVRN
jgi:hypothetical protein